MKRATFDPPPGLQAWELEIGGEVFVLFEWSAVAPAPIVGLTVAESEVAAAVIAGASNAEIARARGTRVRTVANQVNAIFRKLGVSSRAELIRRATSRHESR